MRRYKHPIKRVRKPKKRNLEQDGGDDLLEFPELEEWMVAGSGK